MYANVSAKRPSLPDPQLGTLFEEVEALFYRCEEDDNLGRVERLLQPLLERDTDPTLLARVHAELARLEVMRYEYASAKERLAIAEKGVKLAKRALEYDPHNLQANVWGAATMGLHGLEMGILSTLFYLGPIRECAEQALALDETYQNAFSHQILGDLYRLTPPKPVGMGDKRKALEHLLRAKALAPTCPQARLRLAELYLSLRKKDLARAETQFVLDQEILEHGPQYAAKLKARAQALMEKLN